MNIPPFALPLPNGHKTTVIAGIAVGTNGQGQKVTKTVPLEYNESTLANGHVTRVASGIVKATGENGEEITKQFQLSTEKLLKGSSLLLSAQLH